MTAKPLGAAFQHAQASGKDQSKAAVRRRANAYLSRQGRAPMSRKVAKGILDRWRAMTTDERADEFNLRAAGVPPDVARALAMTGNGKAPKRKPKFGGLIAKMGPTLAELDAPGHTTGLTGSQALRGATWRRRKRINKLADAMVARVTKGGEFDESKHPRAEDGKFGQGSGNSKNSKAPSSHDRASQNNYGQALTDKKHIKALHSYTSQDEGPTGYLAVNAAAAGKKTYAYSRQDAAATSQSVAALSAAISNSQLQKKMTLYRGASVPASAKVGDVLAKNGFTSASKNKKTAAFFADKHAQHNQNNSNKELHSSVLAIRAKAGNAALDVAGAMGQSASNVVRQEGEHIFGHNTRFRIVSDDGKSKAGHRLLTVEPIDETSVAKGGPGSGPHAGGGTSVASHLSAARSHLAAAKLARGKGENATADSHQQRAAARIQAALTARSVAKAGEFDESKHPRADNGEFGAGGGGKDDTHDAHTSDVGTGPAQSGSRGKPFGAMSTREHVEEAKKRSEQHKKALASGKNAKAEEHLAASKAHLDAAKKGIANKQVATAEEISAARTKVLGAYTNGGTNAQNAIRAKLPSHVRDALDGVNRTVTRQERAEDKQQSPAASAKIREMLHKTAIAKRHMVSQIAEQMIQAAYEEPRLPAGSPTYTDPPEFARYLDAQRLVAGMDTELSVDGTQTAAQARARASRALATSMGAYDRTIAGQDRALAHVGGLNLDLGSGQARERGFLGVDTYPYDYGTVVADLALGIPFPDGSARAVRLVDALQQMPDFTTDATALMLEVQRVLGIGGRFYYRGPALQDIVDWSQLPGLGVVSHQFGDGGKTLSITMQRQAARLPLVYGADVQQLSRQEALPSDIAEARAEFGELPPASVAMANLVAKQHVNVQASIVRKRDYDRVVLGPILIPDVPDSQNDTMTARDIEETAHNFLADARLVGREHSDTWEGAQVVESYIAPCELSFADEMYGPQVVPKGSWILGVRIPEESWTDVLDGSVTGFSVGGWGEREDVAPTDQ